MMTNDDAAARPLRKILVPLDGSAHGEGVLETAAAIAYAAGAQLELVHVTPPIPPLSVAAPFSRAGRAEVLGAERSLAYLRSVAERLARAEVKAHPVALVGPVVATLVRYTADSSADLVVLARRTDGGLRRAWLGSTADAFARRSPAPVLVIAGTEARLAAQGAAHARAAGRTEAPTAPFRHVLIPLDASGFGARALPLAITLGSLGGARYTLVRVIFPPYLLGRPYEAAGPAMDAADAAKKARAELDTVGAEMREQGLEVETTVLLGAAPAEAILAFAADHPVDLIAMSTHELGALQRLVLTSVADTVLLRSKMPVLLVRPGVGRR